jgi:gliding motility-associated-like protein
MRKYLINNWKSYVILLQIIFASELVFANTPEKILGHTSKGFIENLGQITEQNGNPAPYVNFLLQKGNTKIFLLRNGGIAYQIEKLTYPEGYSEALHNKSIDLDGSDKLNELNKQIKVETFRTDMELVGANPNAVITKEGKSEDYENYYNKGVTNVHHYNKVIYKNIYPGIDWVVYTNEGDLKYDFIVHPGADPTKIKMKYKFQDNLELNANNDLIIKTKLGNIQEVHPVASQNSQPKDINFIRENDVISFSIKNYNKSQTLIIDPLVRVWGTYYGGTNFEGLSDITIKNGNTIYLCGSSNSQNNINIGGYQNTYAGNTDAFLLKINANGTPIWCSYYGGNLQDGALSIACDQNSNVYISGETYSTSNISYNGHQNNLGGTKDAFLVKFDSLGQLLWATYYGGPSNTSTPQGASGFSRGLTINVGLNGEIFMAGVTDSRMGISTNGTTIHGTTSDGFIAKFNNNGVRLWGTYFGDWGSDAISDIKTDAIGNIYFAGGTSSSNNVAFNGFQNTFGGNQDVFLVKQDSAGNLIWSTYYGGNDTDNNPQIALDNQNSVYICGQTLSSNDISFNGFQNMYGGLYDIFLVKLNSSGQRIWGTYYGSSNNERIGDLFIDNFNNIILSGFGLGSSNLIFNGYQNTYGGGNADSYLIKFNSTGQRIWGTYYGGGDTDVPSSCAGDNNGNIYLIGYSSSANNISFNGYQNTNMGSDDAFIVKFSDINQNPPFTAFTLTDTSFCSGTCVNFTNQSTRDSSWLWLFPGGNPSSSNLQTPPQVCYNTPGTYSVTLITSNAFGSDTLTLNNYITVDSSPNAVINTNVSTCEGTAVNLTSSGGNSYSWSGPNGFTSNLQNPTIINSTVTNSGTYSVVVSNSLGCTDTATSQININAVTLAVANSNSPLCAGQALNLTSNSAATYSWSGPNGFTSSLQNPNIASATTNSSGTYTLIVTNSNGCKDTTTLTVNVLANNPITVTSNGPLCTGQTLNLTASNGSSYVWSGPNGFTSTLQNPTINNVASINAGSYSVVVTRSNGCTNTASTTVSITNGISAVANSNSPLCEGQTLNLTSNSASSYSWSGPNGFISNLQNPSISNLSNNNAGTYTLIVAIGNGCADTTTLSISVLANNPVSVNSNGPLCAGQTLNLTASAGTSYAWNGPNGFTSTLQNPTINNAVVNNSGSYTVVVTNSNGCTNSTSLTVSINPNTPVTASSNSPICEGDNLTMNASAGSSYSWTGPNGFTSSIQNPTITNITTASSGLYSVTVTNACGTGSSNTQVQVGQKPTAGIAVTQTVICEGDTVYLAANGGSSYYWYGPNGFNSILSNPTLNNFSSTNTGTYYLVATNTDNCSDTTVVNLALNESTCFFIPSVFTPNNDGTNDTWVIEGLWQFPNCVVKVYNRWGQSLFESKGYASPWDGTFEGNECPIADYYYIIDLKNGSKVFTGTLTIKR